MSYIQQIGQKNITTKLLFEEISDADSELRHPGWEMTKAVTLLGKRTQLGVVGPGQVRHEKCLAN